VTDLLARAQAHARALQPRIDVTVVTVEADEQVAVRARDNDWPSFVQLETGDAVTLVPSLGTFDLVFADAPGGKWIGLEATVRAPAGFWSWTTCLPSRSGRMPQP
jgi:hypothetical protein